VTDSFEHGSIKGKAGEILNQLSDYQLLHGVSYLGNIKPGE
jgi:hypothetical protein